MGLSRRATSAVIGSLLWLAPIATTTVSASAELALPGAPGPRDADRVRSRAAHADVLAALDPATAADATGISGEVLRLALQAVRCAVTTGAIQPPPTLTVIDYSKPSTEPRLWVFDAHTGELLFEELVAHGVNTGDNLARHFSDAPGSRQSSIGLFVTGDTYVGRNGYSLRLDGLEPGINGRARERAIVMHGAWYVDGALARRQGRLGRSWGCPAVRDAIARDLIDTVRGGGVIFSYYPDDEWLSTSRFLNGCGAGAPRLASHGTN